MHRTSVLQHPYGKSFNSIDDHPRGEEGGNVLVPSEPEKEPTKSEPGAAKPNRDDVRELTPEEREELRKKIEEAAKDDPNIYPVF